MPLSSSGIVVDYSSRGVVFAATMPVLRWLLVAMGVVVWGALVKKCSVSRER